MAKISVLIPSYNHSLYIEKCIDSVINQTFEDIEILIGDDCSTDNSRDIINKFNDERIKKYFYDINCGGSENLNKLINLASGEYIAILNSDDYWEIDKLEKQYSFMEKNKEYAACFTWVQYIDKNGKKIYPDNNVFIQENKTQSEWLHYFFYQGNCLCHPSILIRKKIYDDIGKYYVKCRQIPDFIEWIKIVKKYPIYIMPELLVNFRWLDEGKNTSGVSIQNINRSYYEYYMIASEFFDGCSIDFLSKNFNIDKSRCKKNELFFEFEKNKLLYENGIFGNMGKIVGYTNIGKLLEVEKNRRLLLKEYNFSINDYYKMGESYNFHPINIVQTIETVPGYISCSKGHKYLLRIYNSKIYKIIQKIRKKLFKKR